MVYKSVSTTHPTNDSAGDDQLISRHVVDIIFTAIKREASSIDMYNRLVHHTTDQHHQHNILQALDYKKRHWSQFTDLYTTLTGKQPEYQTDKVPFSSYEDGLQKAHEAGITGYEMYRKNSRATSYPPIRHAFSNAAHSEIEHAARFGLLADETLKDYGPQPLVIDIEDATEDNNNYRTAIWTGKYLQVTLMSIPVGEDIGLEIHEATDQFIRIEEGEGLVQMGDRKDQLSFEKKVREDYAILIPAGKWHNVINTGRKPLKIYAIYAPPEHPHGTVQATKEAAMAGES